MVYQRVKSAALSADGLILLDQVQIGDIYGLVNKTDISAGHIKLSSVEQSADYRTVSDTEKQAWVDGIQQAIDDAATAQDTADGKIETFFQNDAPTSGMGLGDLWFDTNDSNKCYRYNGASWEAARDSGIATAISAAATAQSTADGKIVTYFQAYQPTATAVGDLWVDTDDSNKMYRWNGSSWVLMQWKLEAAGATNVWYERSGLVMDTRYGIAIYGADMAFATFADESNYDAYLAHRVASETELAREHCQCYMDSTGRICAGAGAVKLDANGLTIDGQYLKLKNGSTSFGWIWGDGTKLQIDSNGHIIHLNPGASYPVELTASKIKPLSTCDLGDSSYPFRYLYAYYIKSAYELQAPQVISAVPEVGSIAYENGALDCYVNGAWHGCYYDF
jgi:hypothetical protein